MRLSLRASRRLTSPFPLWERGSESVAAPCPLFAAWHRRRGCLENPPMAESPTNADLLSQGLFHHRQGQLAQAMERYTAVLRTDPNNADALYYVAAVACQEGQYKEGVELPSDLGGLVYVKMDDGRGWRFKLAEELDAAGIQVDFNRLRGS